MVSRARGITVLENMNGPQLGAIVAVWLVWMIINAVIAQAKNLNIAGVVLLSLLLSPLVGWLYAAGMPPMAAQPKPGAEYLDGR